MFKQLCLLTHVLFHKPACFFINDKQMKLEVSEGTLKCSSFGECKNNWRVANKKELKAFTAKHSPGFLFEIHALSQRTKRKAICMLPKIFKTNPDGAIVHSAISQIDNLPMRSIILLVKD